MAQTVRRRLRLELFNGYARSQHARTFAWSTSRRGETGRERDVTHDYTKRVTQLQSHMSLDGCYPRFLPVFSDQRAPIIQIKAEADRLKPSETTGEDVPVTVAGRVHSVRSAGSKLVFMDLKDGESEDDMIQVLSQFGTLETAGTTLEHFKSYAKTARKGDWYMVTGRQHKTARGEPSVVATELPRLLSPCLHQIPESLDDPETRARKRHVDMLANPQVVQTLRVRHEIERHMHNFFADRDFIQVSTPILTASAGGAVARPFDTEATELEGQPLNLRIAPELWLKRLVIGGVPRVYEIGPAFRNEGVDATHNPEFTMCEFYTAFDTLDGVIAMTETMLNGMHARIEQLRSSVLRHIPSTEVSFATPFRRLEFIPVLERALGQSLPDLGAQNAIESLLTIFQEKSLATPTNHTLPRLLDALSATHLEPQCDAPTFITHHPACMSPLAKHFRCPATGQLVAARAELFIRAREYANMYEEENSPFAQRAKLEEQLRFRRVDGEGAAEGVDESYLEALEWGLPPTAGWGGGVDRLVMLFAGRERMSDVLAFGSLRNVAGLRRV